MEQMVGDKFQTPVGLFRVYKNSEICSFFVKENSYNTFWLNENLEAKPEGCFNISMDMEFFSIGYEITCELDMVK